MEIKEINRINKEYYERNAKNYEASAWYFFNAYKDNCVDNEVKKCLGRINKPEIKIIEIGPGTGYLLGKIIKHKKFKVDYLGLEHSTKMAGILINRYRNRIEKMRINNESINVETVDLITEKFDLIIGSSILHHLPDYAAVVKKLADKLADNGIMYFVREPLGRNDCKPSNVIKDIFESIFRNIDYLILKPFIKKILWPQKVKQEDSKRIAPVMYDEGISLSIFNGLKTKGFSILFLRKYNRRATSFFSYMENKWLSFVRKDTFGNTLFSIALQKS